MERKINSARGKIGLYYENLATGEKFEILHGTDDDVFEAASVIKLWVMSAAFEQAENGLLDLDSKVFIREEDKMPVAGLPDYAAMKFEGVLNDDMFPESGVLNFLGPGPELTIRDLIILMILVSDNTAVNVLIDLLGQDTINSHIRSLGAEKTVLKRKLFDKRPETEGLENLFSLEEAASFLRMIYKGELVSEEASKEMCAILQNQQNTYKIPFFMRHTPIAHKTGEDLGIENDVGIVYAEEPYIMCFASNEADEAEAIRLCQDLAKILKDRGDMA
ncbi:MAG: serine hydrolase [Firmicutes bacterium]|nr:serine hydrolase [Bacillota bacterium]